MYMFHTQMFRLDTKGAGNPEGFMGYIFDKEINYFFFMVQGEATEFI